MPNNIKVSDMEEVTQLTKDDLVMVAQPNIDPEDPTAEVESYSSKRTTVEDLANTAAKDIQFTSDLQTKSKTLTGAINEAAEVGKKSEELEVENFSTKNYPDGYYGSPCWIDSGETVDEHIVYKSDAGTYGRQAGDSLCKFSVVGYDDVTLYVKQDNQDTHRSYMLLGYLNAAVSKSYCAECYQDETLTDYVYKQYTDLNGKPSEIEVLYHVDSPTVPGSVSINLQDGQWVSTSETVDGNTVYKSDAGSYHIPDGSSKCIITVSGVSNFSIFCKPSSERGYDKTYIGKLDTTVSKDDSSTYKEAFSGDGYDYTEVNYEINDANTHTIEILYAKDGGSDDYDDCGYIYFTKNGTPNESRGYVYIVPGTVHTPQGEVFNDYSHNYAIGLNSHAEGSYTRATANSAHAEGYASKAAGDYSHAEGYQTEASYCSHTEGYSTKASYYGHAEGYQTEAPYYGHAEGRETKATGEVSHAEGWGTQAFGNQGHAEGRNTIASGPQSHAEGYRTQALGQYSHAEGNGGNTPNIASGQSSHTEGYGSLASGTCAHAEGSGCTASGSYSHAEGESTVASNSEAHAEGHSTEASGFASHAEGNYTTASGLGAHSEGYEYTTASGDGSHAEGYGRTDSNLGSGPVVASGKGAHAEGTNTTASGNFSHAEGAKNTASSYAAHAEGESTSALSVCAHTEGYLSSATAYNTHAEGKGTQATGAQSHAEGEYSIASGRGAHAEGCGDSTYHSVASGQGSHAEGQSTASNDFAHSEGNNTLASGQYSHAEGYNSTRATAMGAHAEGNGSQATGICSHAEGGLSVASGQESHAEGGGTNAYGGHSHSEGAGTSAYSHCGHAEGAGSHTYQEAGHVEGAGNINAAAHGHVEGSGNRNAPIASSSHIEGGGNTSWGSQTHIEGGGNYISGQESHAEGGGNTLHGYKSHIEGGGNKSYGMGSHVEGKHNLAVGYGLHAEGMQNAIGAETVTEFSYGTSYLENDVVVANAVYTEIASPEEDSAFLFRCKNAPGQIQAGANVEIITPTQWSSSTSYTAGDVVYRTISWNVCLHFYANSDVSVGDDPLVNNNNKWNLISNYLSPLIGTTTTGYYLLNTSVSSSSPIAHVTDTVEPMWEKVNTPFGSHVEGLGNIATGDYQHVGGKYNTADSNKAFIIGNGTKVQDTITRSNALTVDWSGNMALAGDITPGTSLATTASTLAAAINELAARIPAPPTTDGTYTLSVTVSSGVPTYSWV